MEGSELDLADLHGGGTMALPCYGTHARMDNARTVCHNNLDGMANMPLLEE